MNEGDFAQNEEVRSSTSEISENFLSIISEMNNLLSQIDFSSLPISYVHNPTVYGNNIFSEYINRYCQNTKKILYLGSDPGWGAILHGNPFGTKSIKNDWLKIRNPMTLPPGINEAPEDLQEIFEETGTRFWSFVTGRYENPTNFFRHSFVLNYCPLAFFVNDRFTITLEQICNNHSKTPALHQLVNICNEALVDIINLLNIKVVVCLGRFCEARVKENYNSLSDILSVCEVYHPSPRNESIPEIGWKAYVEDKLLNNGILEYAESSS